MVVSEMTDFYPRPPHGERRVYYLTLEETDTISIHAPRMGSDVCLPRLYTLQIIFLSTPPAWGATKEDRMVAPYMIDFYPRPPHGERPEDAIESTDEYNFYPRPPHGERPVVFAVFPISHSKFLSTPPAWGATR